MTLLLGDGFLGEHPSSTEYVPADLKSTETFLAKLSKIAHSRKKERRSRNYAIRFAAASQRQEPKFKICSELCSPPDSMYVQTVERF